MLTGEMRFHDSTAIINEEYKVILPEKLAASCEYVTNQAGLSPA
jgi:hypothetical protein